ncbi:hypothetical protein LEMLEM_LOCUS12520, partial [Lemmus lemmus]
VSLSSSGIAVSLDSVQALQHVSSSTGKSTSEYKQSKPQPEYSSYSALIAYNRRQEREKGAFQTLTSASAFGHSKRVWNQGPSLGLY